MFGLLIIRFWVTQMIIKGRPDWWLLCSIAPLGKGAWPARETSVWDRISQWHGPEDWPERCLDVESNLKYGGMGPESPLVVVLKTGGGCRSEDSDIAICHSDSDSAAW